MCVTVVVACSTVAEPIGMCEGEGAVLIVCRRSSTCCCSCVDLKRTSATRANSTRWKSRESTAALGFAGRSAAEESERMDTIGRKSSSIGKWAKRSPSGVDRRYDRFDSTIARRQPRKQSRQHRLYALHKALTMRCLDVEIQLAHRQGERRH
jgi:hypothetical protein